MRPALLALLLVGALASGLQARTPDELQASVEQDFLARPYLGAGWVRVRSEGEGTIVLVGRVPDERFRGLLVLAARNRGARRVVNELEVDRTLELPRTFEHDRRLRLVSNARKLLRRHLELGRYTTLRVGVEDRRIVLRGSVARRAERREAFEAIARLGVFPKNRLEVDRDASRRSLAGMTTAAGAELVAAITSAIAEDPRLQRDVTVFAAMRGSEVVLDGFARHQVAHDYAVELARSLVRAEEERRRRKGPFERLVRGVPDLEPLPLGEVVSHVLVGEVAATTPPER